MSAGDLWQTPIYIYDWLDEEFHFKLDAAANCYNHKCDYYFTEENNSLNQSWGINPVWLNPPYSDPLPWVNKAYMESLEGATVVCLLPADISTKWFHEWVMDKAEIRFVKGRINFDNPVPGKYNSPKFGSMIAIYGPDIIPKVISVTRPEKPNKKVED